MPYQMPEGKTSAVFKILNNSTVNYGNDFAIDDIEVRICKPSIDVTSQENNSCIGSNLSLVADFINDGTYTEPVVYEWYYSQNSQIQSDDWTLVGNAKNLVIPNLTEDNNGFYRVFVGNTGSQNIINNCTPASDLVEVSVKKCTPPVCNADTINIATCLTIDSLINILDNDSISNRDNATVSLINAPAYTKVVGNMLAYSLVDLETTADTILYSVTPGFAILSFNTSIDHFCLTSPTKAFICSGFALSSLEENPDTAFASAVTGIIK